MDKAKSLQPMLGAVNAFTITAPDLEDSLHFYQQLGFRELMRSDFPFRFIQITDDAILIMLREGSDPYLALTYYTQDATTISDNLSKAGIAFNSLPGANDMIRRYLFQSPDGANVSIVQVPDVFARPSGRTMLTMDQSEYMMPESYTNKTVGMFGEFAESVADLEKSIEFWEKLGFAVLTKYSTPAPWAIMSDGLAIVGLHQTKEFSGPAITFFASDMKKKIAALREKGVPCEDIGPGNTVVKTPEQQKLFLFNLGL